MPVNWSVLCFTPPEEVLVIRRRYIDIEGVAISPPLGNAAIFPAHFSDTSSSMLDAPWRRRISSTSNEGPDITFESDTLRMVRRSTPPRRIEVLLCDVDVPATGLPMVKSTPFLLPPLYPPAAVCDKGEFEAYVGER